MYVRSVSVENFRHFEKAEVNFVYLGNEQRNGKDVLPNVTLLLGINGAGKTSVLKAVAHSTLSPVIQSSGFNPSFLVGRSTGSGMRVHLSNRGYHLSPALLQPKDCQTHGDDRRCDGG